jgi:pimeloyl-ACP methyl ester carboxylesterase
MLALVHAAEHPRQVRSVVAIGCGTFDSATRDLYNRRLGERMDAAACEQIQRLDTAGLDANELLRRKAELLLPAYSHDLVTTDLEHTGIDARGNQEAWTDMLRLQATGVYPQAFERIAAPVLMLHGALDPHPGQAIRDSLAPRVRQLEYHEWADCGHYPWHERSTRSQFYERLEAWLRAVEDADARATIDEGLAGQADRVS